VNFAIDYVNVGYLLFSVITVHYNWVKLNCVINFIIIFLTAYMQCN